MMLHLFGRSLGSAGLRADNALQVRVKKITATSDAESTSNAMRLKEGVGEREALASQCRDDGRRGQWRR